MAWRSRLSRNLRVIHRQASPACSQTRGIMYGSSGNLRSPNSNVLVSFDRCKGAEIRPWAGYGQYSLTRRCYFEGPCSHYMYLMKIRPFSTTSGSIDESPVEVGGQKETISVTFMDKDGEEKIVKVPIGMSMLEAAHENDIELEGACEGSLACSTCHVIVMDVDYYNKLEEPTDEENDMLDLAFGLTETSRLGCQVIAKPELDGMRLALPAATRNFAVDGYVPKPH